jgi:succinyl-CoA synthetase beta subunit
VGGGVKLAKSMDEVKKYASEIMGMQLKTHQTGPEGQKVRRLLIEDGADIKKEYYFSIVTDRGSQKNVIMASSEGGMDIEEVAEHSPEKIIKVFVDPLIGLTDAQCDTISKGIGVPEGSVAKAREVFIQNVLGNRCFFSRNQSADFGRQRQYQGFGCQVQL